MGPCVSVGRNQIASMTNVAIVEMIVGSFDEIFEADTNAHPSHKLLDFDAPLHHLAYIFYLVLSGRGSSIRQKRCPLDYMPDCSAII